MSLERYCRDRLVVLNPRATAREAARAMESNHIGAVVVQDRGTIAGIVTDRDLALKICGPGLDASQTPVADVMTPDPVTIGIDESEASALELMRELHVRRLVIVSAGRLAGIVTLDDLLMTGVADGTSAREIVMAQLSDAAPAKPDGFVRPTRLYRSDDRAQQRSIARREQTIRAFARRLAELVGIDDHRAAVQLFETVAAHIVRRITPAEAKDFLAQLPFDIRERLLDVRAGPDRDVTREQIEDAVAWRLGVDHDQARDLVAKVAMAFDAFVSPGEMDEVRSMLPRDLQDLFVGSGVAETH